MCVCGGGGGGGGQSQGVKLESLILFSNFSQDWQCT